MNEFLEISRAVSNIAANPWAAVLLIVLVILWLFMSFQRSKREKRESEVKHRHAPNLMDELDRYVAYCVRVAYDDGRGIDVSESPPPIYSEDINWEAMDSKIHYRVRSLLNASKEIAASFDSSSVEIKSPDCEKYFEEKQLAYARLGLEACDIAKQARGIYGIPRPGILKGERPEIALKRKVGEIEGSRRRKTTKERLEKSVHRLRSFLSRR